MINYYKILNIQQNASQEDIKKAYRRMAKLTHPDIVKKAQIDFKLVNEAYSTLSSPTLKDAYDKKLYENLKYGNNAHQEDDDLKYDFVNTNHYSKNAKLNEMIFIKLVQHIEQFLSEKPENDVDILFDEFKKYFKNVIMPELKDFLQYHFIDDIDVNNNDNYPTLSEDIKIKINHNNVYPIFKEIWSKYKYYKKFSHNHMNSYTN